MACQKNESERQAATVRNDGNVWVAEISGNNAKADVNGNKIMLQNNEVFIDGKSFGSVPKGAKVVFRMDSNGSELIVDGETRYLINK